MTAIAHDVDHRLLPCLGPQQDLWFAAEPAALEQAKALCHGCPVRRACLDGALARHEPWGVWGGQLFWKGRMVPYKRTRGRPRKVPDEPVRRRSEEHR